MTAKERIYIVLKDTGLGSVQLAAEIGLKHSRISDVAKGKTKNISPEIVNAICRKFPMYSEKFLLYGEGEIYKSQNNPDTEKVGNPDIIERARESVALLEEVLAQARENAAILRKSQDLFERVLELYEDRTTHPKGLPYAIAEDFLKTKNPKNQPKK